MRGLTAAGFLVAFAIVGVLAIQGMQAESSGEPIPTQAIDKANGAAQTIQNAGQLGKP